MSDVFHPVLFWFVAFEAIVAGWNDTLGLCMAYVYKIGIQEFSFVRFV